MNELSTETEKKMTTRQVAEALGCAVNTVRETVYLTVEEVERNNFNFYKNFAPWISDETAWNWAKNPLRDENGICKGDDMGLLYIATDTSKPGEYKIGRTRCNDPFTRELHTTSPNYKILYMAVSRDIVKDEARVHKWCSDMLKSHIKYKKANEWFRLDDDYLQFVIDKFHFVKAGKPFKYMKWSNENIDMVRNN